MLDGRRPVFIDRTETTFFFPYRHIRFIEMPSVSLAQLSPGEPVPVAPEAEAEPEVDLDFDLELDEDFLRRGGAGRQPPAWVRGALSPRGVARTPHGRRPGSPPAGGG